jgi:hypothetical protein
MIPKTGRFATPDFSACVADVNEALKNRFILQFFFEISVSFYYTCIYSNWVFRGMQGIEKG